MVAGPVPRLHWSARNATVSRGKRRAFPFPFASSRCRLTGARKPCGDISRMLAASAGVNDSPVGSATTWGRRRAFNHSAALPESTSRRNANPQPDSKAEMRLMVWLTCSSVLSVLRDGKQNRLTLLSKANVRAAFVFDDFSAGGQRANALKLVGFRHYCSFYLAVSVLSISFSSSVVSGLLGSRWSNR
jgi:hypothetical protein